ncbi:QWRF motif-containing protein 3 isoform X1 [Magnolia sinica]|uniref:QWRF motif-containing protein 3 isoform X1 n=1 Tax=Magnolia sinica TaxID=86752 RepID=UPI002659EDC2|nr:QWRF motif-containing protein 3 isoform X1 [Magnolia sinica]
MKNEAQDPPFKPLRSKSRDVSSRFLSPTSPSSTESGISSPIHALSPIRRKASGIPSDSRRHRSVEEAGLVRGLWPSSTSSKKSNTLADHLGNDRLIDFIERKNGDRSSSKTLQFFGRQKSCSEFNRFENEKEGSKENRPAGGSMRYTGKFKFPGKKSTSSASFTPGRISVVENALERRRKSDSFADFPSSESDISATTDISSASMGRTRKAGIEVPSRFLQDPSITRTPRRGPDSSNPTVENSPNLSYWMSKNAIKRSNSLTAYSSATTQWALSPGRTASPPMSAEMGKPTPSFSSLRPPTSPSKSKGVGNLISLGLELFKGKKSSSSSSSSSPSSLSSAVAGFEAVESVHQLRMLHNRLLQWKFANARADAVNQSRAAQSESSLVNAWSTLSQLQSSVVQKRIQLEKEKLELKLNRVLKSQIKSLEAWADMERQHISAVSTTKDCIHSVVCRVPLIEGAKADSQPTSMELRHAADLTASINTMISDFTPMATRTVPLLSELAEVVTRERALLEECFELLGVVANLELKERSLKCHIIQLKTHQPQQQQQAQLQSTV